MSLYRYALQLIDTVLVGSEKATCLTTGLKSVKDTMFFLNQDEDEAPSKASAKKPPAAKSNGNASPAKNKMAGGKVLRNKTRGAAQEEAIQTAAAKIAEHQRNERVKKVYEQQLKISARFNQPPPPVPPVIAHLYPDVVEAQKKAAAELQNARKKNPMEKVQ